MRKIIAGIDIGSDTIKIIVAEVMRSRTNILAVAETESKGLKNGLVVNKEAFTPVLKETIKKAEDILGLKIRKVVITVPSFHAEFMISEGVTTITNEDKVVRGIDIVRAMQASVYNHIPENYEVVDIVPAAFKVNEGETIKNPLNMLANKLYVKTVISMIPKENLTPILESFSKIDVEVIDTAFSSVGDYYALKTEKTDNQVGAFINIGHANTTVSIFNKEFLPTHL